MVCLSAVSPIFIFTPLTVLTNHPCAFFVPVATMSQGQILITLWSGHTGWESGDPLFGLCGLLPSGNGVTVGSSAKDYSFMGLDRGACAAQPC